MVRQSRGMGTNRAGTRTAPSAGKHNVSALATANCYTKRTDLACELVGSLLFGWLFSRAGMVPCLALTGVVCLAALPLQTLTILQVGRRRGVVCGVQQAGRQAGAVPGGRVRWGAGSGGAGGMDGWAHAVTAA